VQCVADAAATSTEQRALELIRTVSSALVVAPGHPSPLYLVRGFCNAIAKRADWSNPQAFLASLGLVEAITRTKLPYRLANGVDSNDALYGDDDQQYSSEALALCKAQEARITSGKHLEMEARECAKLVERILANLKDRTTQVEMARGRSKES
jgi:hypothetical protein